jgi:hypothetical protein
MEEYSTGQIEYDPLAQEYASSSTFSSAVKKYPTATYKRQLIENTKQTKELTMEKLYEVNGKNRYGVFMTENSRGQAILEMKDTGQYEAFAYADISKVMPYTFDVMFQGKGQVYSYKGVAGSVEVGDILILEPNFTIVTVVGVDTKSESATKAFTGRKLVTTPL